MKVKENVQKIKTVVRLFFVTVLMMLPMAVEVEANVQVGLNEENQTATISAYLSVDDQECKELAIPSEVLSGGKSYTVTAIDSRAFENACYLEKIVIPATVKEIGNGAFVNCSALKEINLPTGIKKIGPSTFLGCSSLEEIVIPDTVESIGAAAFLQCSKLKKIKIPNSVVEIDMNCFQQCEALEEIVLPNGLTEISQGMFIACSNLKKIVIPDGVTRIDSYVFKDCSSLKEVVFPESLEYISPGIFEGCSNLKAVYYPKNFENISHIGLSENVAEICYVINDDETVSLTVEKLPEGVTDIDLPSDIGGRTIVSITGPEGVEIAITCAEHFAKEYSKNAGEHCYTCTVCKKVVREAHAYGAASEADSKPCECGYVPFAITAQPANLQLAYGYKNGSLAVTAKTTFGTEKVAYQWYENGKAISGATAATYKVPKGKPVGSYAYTCKLTSGGYSAVIKAATVTVKAPAKGSKYKDDKNMATYKITKARADGKGTVEYVKPSNKKKGTVTIPATVKIGGVTYKVTSIAKNAFKGNRYIKRLTIEKNVEKIGARAFYGCKKLKTITIKTTKLTAKKIGANAFKNIKSNATIKVPKKKLKAYKTMLRKKGVGATAKIRKI